MNTSHDTVLDKPELVSGIRRGTEGTITLLAWIGWSFLLVPLLTSFLWAIGLRYLFIEQWRLTGWRALGGVLSWYAAILAVIGLILLLWSMYNRRRFDQKDLRQFPQWVTEDELAARYRVSVEKVKALRQAQIIVVDFGHGATRWEEETV